MKLIQKIRPEHDEYLYDEARNTGYADTISFPRSEEEVVEIVNYYSENNGAVTVQGALTGLAGGAVPWGGHVMNLSRMDKMTAFRYDKARDEFFLTVQPGVLLSSVRKALQSKIAVIDEWSEDSKKAWRNLKAGDWFYSPDPTEPTASIGGIVSCNASGARSYKYGPARNYVESLRVVLCDGSVLKIRRGEQFAVGRKFSLTVNEDKTISGDLPTYEVPDTKDASAYFINDDMDLIDLFIGAQGTLGVITEIELRIIRAPKADWGVTAFFPSEEMAIRYVQALRNEDPGDGIKGFDLNPAAIEFFDYKSLDLLAERKKTMSLFSQIQEIKEDYNTGIYAEFHAMKEEDIRGRISLLSEIIEACGGSPDETWVATNPRDMEKLLFFRHAVPELINIIIEENRKNEPSLTMLGTDMAVPNDKLPDAMRMYRKGMEELNIPYIIFGHIGASHVHVNILPRDLDDYNRGKALYHQWADEIGKIDGSVSAEHGVGKLKANLLESTFGKKGVAQMLDVKKTFDPDFLFGRGTMFEATGKLK